MTRRTSPLATAALGVGLLGAGTAGYAGLVERNAFTLRRWDVPVLAPQAAPLRVLHVSDIHMREGQRRKQAWVADLARLAPDLVVLTGDNLAGATAVPATLRALEPLFAFPGVFVFGSNDYYGPVPKNPLKYFNPRHKRVHGPELPWQDLRDGLLAAGWLDLTNRRTTMAVAGRSVELRGVDDPHLKLDDLPAVAGPASPVADLAVGLVHAPEPRVLDAFVADGVQLVLSGHTHGGQLRIPGYGALVTNCGLDRDRCRWVSEYAAPGQVRAPAMLHVSAGLGTSPFAPARFACPPEASLLTLTPRVR
ncbi:MAG TPA: metallophosphoesterase [Frankiaceae bacterium]|jgi:predicted MPP superfamily phosphohydrolase